MLFPRVSSYCHDLIVGIQICYHKDLSVFTACSEPTKTTNSAQLRIFQWNMLSQSKLRWNEIRKHRLIKFFFILALGMHNDGFVRCPTDALTWECRRYQVIQEIVQNDPDIVCLQVSVFIIETLHPTNFTHF